MKISRSFWEARGLHLIVKINMNFCRVQIVTFETLESYVWWFLIIYAMCWAWQRTRTIERLTHLWWAIRICLFVDCLSIRAINDVFYQYSRWIIIHELLINNLIVLRVIWVSFLFDQASVWNFGAGCSIYRVMEGCMSRFPISYRLASTIIPTWNMSEFGFSTRDWFQFTSIRRLNPNW